MTPSTAALHAKPQPHSRFAELLSRPWRLLQEPGYLETIVFAAAVLSFVASIAFQFVYDDRAQIVSNPAITSWHGVLAYFGSDVWNSYDRTHIHNYYRPLFFVWFRLNYLFFKLQPAGWHVVAVLLHAVVSVLAFRLAARLTADRLAAAVAGLLFAVHPIHIESVAWISGTTDPLMALFLLSAMLWFLSWLEKGSPWKLLATAVFYVLAMLCKEPAIMLLPVLAVLACLYPTGKGAGTRSRTSRLLIGALPLAVLALAYVTLRSHLLQGAAHNVNRLTASDVLYTLPSVALFYLRQSLVPLGLSFAYDMPPQLGLSWQFFWMPLLIFVLLAGLFAFWCVRSPRHRAPLIAAAAICVAWILPALNLHWMPLDELVHDRYLYLPILGLCIIAGVGFRQWIDPVSAIAPAAGSAHAFAAGSPALPHAPAAGSEAIPVSATPKLAALALVSVLLLVATVSQQLDCASDLLLWNRAARISPRSEAALLNLGTVLFEHGEMAEGFQVFQKELRLNPDSQIANYNLGYALYNQQNFAAAEPFVQHAIAVMPGKAESYRLLGSIELRLNRPAVAEQLMRQALAISPRDEGFHNALALVLLERGDTSGAERELLQELQLFPDNKIARQALSQIHSH